jgi:hypothetical protein
MEKLRAASHGPEAKGGSLLNLKSPKITSSKRKEAEKETKLEFQDLVTNETK